MTEEEDRITRDEMLLLMARMAAKRSTCARLHVGAIIARDHRPIVTGYNGAPAGMAHCEHDYEMIIDMGGTIQEGCEISVHAEANAIAYAARAGIALEGAELFCTNEPCYKCSQLIINAGIIRVVFNQPYRLHDGVALLRAAKLQVEQQELWDDQES